MIIITFTYRHRKEIIIGSAILLIIVMIIIGYFYLNDKPKEEIKISPVSNKLEKKEEKENIGLIKVDIKGEILVPGIYTMPIDSRVVDVIEKAGGLTENANTTVINLSKKITDEMVIIIYSNDEVNDFKNTKETEETVLEKCIQKDEESLKNSACIDQTQISDNKSTLISINTATKDELMSLPGIGEKKAQDIIDYRNTNGNFNVIEDIKNIPGIGDSLFAEIKDHITL